MLGIFAVLIIHSAPFDEVAAGPKQLEEQKEFALKGGRTIVVRKIQFIGNKLVTTADLEMEVAEYLHTPISETDLGEIEERVEALYKAKGYKRVQILIPPKQKKGVLTIHIDESALRSKADPA